MFLTNNYKIISLSIDKCSHRNDINENSLSEVRLYTIVYNRVCSDSCNVHVHLVIPYTLERTGQSIESFYNRFQHVKGHFGTLMYP